MNLFRLLSICFVSLGFLVSEAALAGRDDAVNPRKSPEDLPGGRRQVEGTIIKRAEDVVSGKAGAVTAPDSSNAVPAVNVGVVDVSATNALWLRGVKPDVKSKITQEEFADALKMAQERGVIRSVEDAKEFVKHINENGVGASLSDSVVDFNVANSRVRQADGSLAPIYGVGHSGATGGESTVFDPFTSERLDSLGIQKNVQEEIESQISRGKADLLTGEIRDLGTTKASSLVSAHNADFNDVLFVLQASGKMDAFNSDAAYRSAVFKLFHLFSRTGDPEALANLRQILGQKSYGTSELENLFALRSRGIAEGLKQVRGVKLLTDSGAVNQKALEGHRKSYAEDLRKQDEALQKYESDMKKFETDLAKWEEGGGTGARPVMPERPYSDNPLVNMKHSLRNPAGTPAEFAAKSALDDLIAGREVQPHAVKAIQGAILKQNIREDLLKAGLSAEDAKYFVDNCG